MLPRLDGYFNLWTHVIEPSMSFFEMLYAMKWRLAKWLLFVSCSMCLTLNVKGQKGCEEPHSPTPWNVTGKMHDTPQLIGLLFCRCLLEVGSLFPTKRMTLWMSPNWHIIPICRKVLCRKKCTIIFPPSLKKSFGKSEPTLFYSWCVLAFRDAFSFILWYSLLVCRLQ